MKILGWKQWGILFIVISVIAFLLIDKRMDDTAVFHRFLARHAEETAVDCGIIPVRTNPEPGFTCAIEAQRSSKGFFLQVQQQGIDSKIADGWVATHDGEVLRLNYDSDPSGGSRAGAVIYQRTCINPEFSARQITCDNFASTLRIPLSLPDTLR